MSLASALPFGAKQGARLLPPLGWGGRWQASIRSPFSYAVVDIIEVISDGALGAIGMALRHVQKYVEAL